PSAEGRWALVPAERARGFSTPARDQNEGATADAPKRLRREGGQPAERGDDRSPKKLALQQQSTRWAAAVTQQLLARHGVLTREAIAAEAIPGSFGIVYPVLKGLEETGRIRRGYFVAGLGATQF